MKLTKLKFLRKALAPAIILAALALTMTGCAPAAGADGGDSTGSMISTLVMVGGLIVVFYFFMIRPENKRKKKAAELRAGLSVGDRITTIGGLVGKIVNIKEDVITFETGEDRVRIEISKWGISTSGSGSEEQKS